MTLKPCFIPAHQGVALIDSQSTRNVCVPLPRGWTPATLLLRSHMYLLSVCWSAMQRAPLQTPAVRVQVGLCAHACVSAM